MTGLILVLISSLSSRYILDQQSDEIDRALVKQLATEIAPVVVTGDLIRLEATLRNMLARHQLQLLTVTDLDERPLGQSGSEITADSLHYRSPIEVDGHIAGELMLARLPGSAIAEQRGMSLGLLSLAVLASLFVAALAGRWGQSMGQRIAALNLKLSTGLAPSETDELSALEASVAALPLELILPPDASDRRGTDFEQSGLLYIHLQSLIRYVETLDEQTLLDYTENQRQLVEGAGALYGGKLTVCREFGLLVSFSGDHPAGSPAFRAASVAWLLRRVAADLTACRHRKHVLGLACGLGEASRDSTRDIYPLLYNQHIIDELAGLTASCDAEQIPVTDAVADDPDVISRCQLHRADNRSELLGLEEPYMDLLERQHLLLLRELGINP